MAVSYRRTFPDVTPPANEALQRIAFAGRLQEAHALYLCAVADYWTKTYLDALLTIIDAHLTDMEKGRAS